MNIIILLPASLMEDQCAERQHQYEARRGLEVAWSERLREKQLEELQQSKAPSILLHQQCEKYHRYGGFTTRCYTLVHGFCFFKLFPIGCIGLK